jgi:hypothetical protein
MVVFKLDLQFRSDAISNMAAIVSDLLTYEIICKLQPLDQQNNLCDFFNLWELLGGRSPPYQLF